MTHPQHFQVVWLDPDVHFLNSNWVNDTSARLDEVNVVQPFAFAYELRAGDDSEKLDANEVTWFIRACFLFLRSIDYDTSLFTRFWNPQIWGLDQD